MKLLKYAGFVPYLAIAFINASVDLAHKNYHSKCITEKFFRREFGCFNGIN